MAQDTIHHKIEKNVVLMFILCLITVSIGGMVQILPLFTIESTIEKVQGMRPYAPLELAGWNIYVREGCYLCHSQQIRPFRDEVERYGHYSLAAESMYDHPFQWGSKRTGPDLARVGGKYSNEWHTAHLVDPRAVVSESVMPTYQWMKTRPLKFDDVQDHMKTLNFVSGKPIYSDDMIANAKADLAAQKNADGSAPALVKRYPKAVVANFTGEKELTEMDALIAYLQMLGTLVDFTNVKPEQLKQ